MSPEGAGYYIDHEHDSYQQSAVDGVLWTRELSTISVDAYNLKRSTKTPHSTRSCGSDESHSHTFNFAESPLPQNRYTVDDALQVIAYGTYQRRILVVCGGIWASNAAEIVILSFLLPILRRDYNAPPPILGIFATLTFLGMLLGAISCNYLSEKYGRLIVMKWCVSGQIIFGVLSAAMPNIPALIALRFCHALNLGSCVVAFKWYLECCPQCSRQRAFVQLLLFWPMGSVISTLIASITLTMLDWRWYLAISSFACAVLLLPCMCCMSESPTWLVRVGEVDEAYIVLCKASKLNHKTLPSGSLKSYAASFPDQFPDDNVSRSRSICSRFEWKQIFAARYRTNSIVLYIICFSSIFGYYGLCMLSARRYFDGGVRRRFAVEMLLTSLSEIVGAALVYCFDCGAMAKSALMASSAIFASCMFVLMFSVQQYTAVMSVALVFIGRMAVLSVWLVVYTHMFANYSSILRDDAIELLFLFGRMAAMITVFVAQSEDLKWACYIYALCGTAMFIASCMLGRFATIRDKMELMQNLHYLRHSVSRIDENTQEDSD